MSTIFSLPKQQAFDNSGDPLGGALLYFYQSGTTTAKNSYADVNLNTAHANPVVADAYGVFPAIFLDTDSGAYRVKLTTAGGVQRFQVDGYSGFQLTGAAALASLLPLDGPGSGLNADLLDNLQGAAYAQLASADFTVLQVGGINVGFKAAPRLSGAGGTAAATWVGKVYATTAGVTIPNAIFAAGDVFAIYNDSASPVTLTQDTGLTLRLGGTTSTGNRTLGARGMCSFWFNTASEAIVNGNVT